MKLILLFLTTTLALLAQDSYSKGKIDMHGGSQDRYYNNYNSIGEYKDGGFRAPPVNMSKFLDRNSSKNETKSKDKK